MQFVADPGSFAELTFRNELALFVSLIPPNNTSSPLASTNEYNINVGGAFGWTGYCCQLKLEIRFNKPG